MLVYYVKYFFKYMYKCMYVRMFKLACGRGRESEMIILHF